MSCPNPLTILLLSFGALLPVAAQTDRPIITAIANVASYSGGPVAPGEMVIIFGTGLGPPQLVNLQLDGQGRFASTLSEVQVFFDGTPAPLIYVSQAQIAAMAPYSVEGKTTTQVQVVYRGTRSDLFSKAVAATAPGIFSADASGKGPAAINNSDGSINSTGNMTMPGSYVTLYVTGEGVTDPPGADGGIATGAANVKAPVSVRIAGRQAQILYAGSAPGNVNGFAQVNAIIPPDLQYGGNLPLVVQIGAASSQPEITVAVSGPPAPLPGTPMSVTANLNSVGQVVLGWTPSDAISPRFHIERRVGSNGSFVEMGAVTGSVISFVDSNTVPGVTYQYRVRAENDYGYSPYSAIASVSAVASQLAAPSKLQAIAVSQIQVTLTWSPANTNATTFQIERKTGTGAYGLLSTVPNTATSFQDTSVIANTTYAYRMRSQGPWGLSEYSNESSVATPSLPLANAPVLQAATLSSSQSHLSWTFSATNVVRFRIERRTTGTQYSEINQLGASATTFDDTGLAPSTTYFYRVRGETGAGLSPYSNEASVTTGQVVPIAPTNLRVTPTSQTQVSLSWTNADTTTLAVHVEIRINAAGYQELRPAFPGSSTSGQLNGLSGGTTYLVRLRAETPTGLSPYSNDVPVTTLPKTTVFVIHGLAQGNTDVQQLAWSLGDASSPDQLDLRRFTVNADFDWHDCANNPLCGGNCTIQGGAAKLASLVARVAPQGNLVFVGYSLGGLISREAIASYPDLSANGRVAALITLGTPNMGYPYVPFDESPLNPLQRCPVLVQQMASDYQGSSDAGVPRYQSTYLLDLSRRWAAMPTSNRPNNWLVMAGTFCSDTTRSILNPVGCSSVYPLSDGIVCQASSYFFRAASSNLPTDAWSNSTFAHSDETLLCTYDQWVSHHNVLYKPPMGSPLLAKIRGLINGL